MATGRGMARLVTARHAMAATANPHATRAALELLRKGGNAVDAAAAAQFVLNVVEPQSSGIGGGGFLLFYSAKEGKVVSIDGREEAPAGATPGMVLRPDGTPEPFFPERITGGRAVGVPGLVMALEKAVQIFGRRSLAEAFAPAIRLAEQGFPVSPRLAILLKKAAGRLSGFPATRKLFFSSNGKPLQSGDLLRQPSLAATFRLIARQGSRGFYRGALAREMVRAVREAPQRPGAMTLADLAGYEAPMRRPVQASYRGFTLYGMAPPSSGGVTLLQMMKLLESAPPLPPQAPRGLSLHRFSQAARLAYADRALYLADPDFVPVPVAGLLAPSYLRGRAGEITWDAPLTPVNAGHPQGGVVGGEGAPGEEGPSTTHISVVDGERNMVALTSSIEQAFGSGMVVPGRGFLLNNQLTDFSAQPRDREGREIANRVEGGRRPRRTALDNPEHKGGKRPRSSMAPTLVLRDGRPLLAIGSPGGPLIIQFVAEALVRILDQGLPLHQALAAAHAIHLSGSTWLEPALAAEAEGLKALGHQPYLREMASGLHAVRIDPATGMLQGAADPRREGTAEGY